jgi:hypothetical protein
MLSLRERVAVARKIFDRRWVKIALVTWGLIAAYDTFLSQFVPEPLAKRFPKMHELITAWSGWLPGWAWLLIPAGIIALACFEYAVRIIPLLKAAQIVYEQTEETVFAKLATRFGNKPSDTLVEIANTIFHQIPVYGARPASRNRKLIDAEAKKSMCVFRDGESAGYAGETSPRYVFLAVRRIDLPKCVDYIRRISDAQV